MNSGGFISDPVAIAESARKARIACAREDINTFLEMVLKHEMTGNSIEQADCHVEWQEACDRHDRVVLYAHIESGKTQNISVGRPLFELGKNPNLRIALVSNTRGQSRKNIRAIAKYIELSDPLHAIFPHLVPGEPWTADAITVKSDITKRDASVQGVGVHGNILGARLDLIILDDILDYENTLNARARQDVWDWYHSTLAGRLTAKGRVIAIGTAWHPEDMLHRLAAQPRWFYMKYPVEDKAGTPMWAEAWPRDRIDLKRTELGPLEFARQMLCEARDDAEARFQRPWIEQCLEAGDGCKMATSALDFFKKHPKLAPPAWFSEDSPELASAMDAINRMQVGVAGQFLTGVDLAVQQHSAADETVLFTIYLHPDGRRQPVEIMAGKWTGPEIVRHIMGVHRRFGSVVLVENNSCFPSSTLVLTKNGYIPIKDVAIGDFVWTHKGRWRKVTKILKGASSSLVEAKAKGCLPVKTTPNHWFYLRRAGRVLGGRNAVDVGKHRPVGAPQWVSYGFRDKPAYAAIAIPHWSACDAVLNLRSTMRETGKKIIVSENIALVLGLYMAKGNCTRGQVVWTFGRDELYLAQFVAAVVEHEIGYPANITEYPERNVIRVTVSSCALADTLNCGTGGRKCLPLEWLGWPLALRIALIRGWFVGNGSLFLNNYSTKWPSFILRGTSISRNWMMFVRTTLAHAHIGTAIRVGTERKTSMIEGRKVKRNKIYEMSLTREGSECLRKDMSAAIEKQRWKKWWKNEITRKSRSHKGCLVLGDMHGWARVPEIEEHPYIACDEVVYNLEVAEDHSFTVEDYIVHNAQQFILQFVLDEQELIPIVPFTTGRNKTDPIWGIESMATEFANCKWSIPSKGGKAVCPQVEKWIQEMLFYDPNGHTGDRLMASWFSRELARRLSAKVTRVGTRVVG